MTCRNNMASWYQDIHSRNPLSPTGNTFLSTYSRSEKKECSKDNITIAWLRKSRGMLRCRITKSRQSKNRRIKTKKRSSKGSPMRYGKLFRRTIGVMSVGSINFSKTSSEKKTKRRSRAVGCNNWSRSNYKYRTRSAK